ncbi:MAG: hypothetical protein GY953_10025, partial [bacterium]|nr:hypothetical protein [bacterium]
MWPRSLQERAESLREAFQSAKPFPHLVIDDFLDDAACRCLGDEFPRRSGDWVAGDYGTVGKKIVRQDLPGLGGAYGELDAVLRSEKYLRVLSRATGI